MQDRDAFVDGVEPGGLLSVREIKSLICYMLAGVGEPMAQQDMVDIVFQNGLANYFEMEAGIDELIERGSLTEDENRVLTLTDIGREVAETMEPVIPYSVRDKAVKAAVQLLTRRRREKETRVDIVKLDNGCEVTCAIDRTDHPMMSITLLVADEAQAALIKECFLNDPALIYRGNIAMLTGDAGRLTLAKRMFIDLP